MPSTDLDPRRHSIWRITGQSCHVAVYHPDSRQYSFFSDGQPAGDTPLPHTLLVDTPYVLVPADEWDPTQAEKLYRYAVSDCQLPLAPPLFLPELATYVLVSVPERAEQLLNAPYTTCRVAPLAAPLWQVMARQQALATPNTLYAWLEEDSIELFTFNNRRLKFANRFAVGHTNDALYYTLFVWKQLGMDPNEHRLVVIGEEATDRLKELIAETGRFLQHVERRALAEQLQLATMQPTIPSDLLAATFLAEL